MSLKSKSYILLIKGYEIAKNLWPYDKKAHAEVKKLALAIKKQLPKGKIIAVHNNKNEYSFKNYLKGQNMCKKKEQHTSLKNMYFETFISLPIIKIIKIKKITFQ